MLLPITLSGGVGARLWPVSREALPNYLLEPSGRNTAPAIAAAALHAARHAGEDTVLLALPADHLILNQDRFAKAVASAVKLARDGCLVTFGITPTRPETGYGYIESQDPIADTDAYRVVRFVEKPDPHTAREYFASGRHTWNSGMFCFTAGSIIAALRTYAPDVWQTVEQTMRNSDVDTTPITLDANTFALTLDISIDRAVMEHAANTAVVRADFDWSDVGSWRTVAELVAPDACGNRVHGETLLVDVKSCYIHKVINGEQELLVGADESTYIPAGHKHRLENPGARDLIMIEVQSGKYLGEDDIVHFHNTYGRA